MCPASRLKSLGVRHHNDEVVVIAFMHGFECEKVAQGRTSFRGVTVTIETEGHFADNFRDADLVRRDIHASVFGGV